MWFVLVILMASTYVVSLGLTTIHYDKPEDMKLEKINSINITKLTNTERQKRLLPYINYYYKQPVNYNHEYYQLNSEQQQLSKKFTPFLKSNAIPGKFTPITNNNNNNANSEPKIVTNEYFQAEKISNYDTLYNKLSQITLVRKILPQVYPNFIIQTPKSVNIETYTPKSIDITIEEPNKYNTQFYLNNNQNDDNRDGKSIILIEKPTNLYDLTSHLPSPPPVPPPPPPPPSPSPSTLQTIHTFQQPKPIILLLSPIKPQLTNIINEQPTHFEKYRPEKHYLQYRKPPVLEIPNKKNNLIQLLKQLQETNTLPQSLTSENIDSSIKTLAAILNNLKKQQKLFKPIVVKEENDYDDHIENENHSYENKEIAKPDIITQNFPPDTVEGGTPGKPGIDYPALSTIPPTDFNCKTQRYKGFFGDPNTNCQVWHYCDLNGGQASFLCPNGTIFSQVALTCDWWYNVKCSATPQQYVLNERLYKYIIPLSPKFPEDYSGPLVDKYLTLKFKEMEEKMAKERKGKINNNAEEITDSIQNVSNDKEVVNNKKK